MSGLLKMLNVYFFVWSAAFFEIRQKTSRMKQFEHYYGAFRSQSARKRPTK